MKCTEEQVRLYQRIASAAGEKDRRDNLIADLAADWLEMRAEIAAKGTPVESYDLRRRGGKWLGAARSWLQHRRTVDGVRGDQITWGDDNAIFQLSARAVEELAAEVAAAAEAERDSLRKRLADTEAVIASADRLYEESRKQNPLALMETPVNHALAAYRRAKEGK